MVTHLNETPVNQLTANKDDGGFVTQVNFTTSISHNLTINQMGLVNGLHKKDLSEKS